MTITTREGINGFEAGQDDTTLSWDDGTRTLTVTPNGTFFKVFAAGRAFIYTAPLSLQIPDTTGQHVLFIDDSGGLKSVQSDAITPNIVKRDALVAVVYWNSTQGTAVLVGDERHGLMDAQTHLHLHESIGSQIQRDSSEGLFRMLGIQGFGNGNNDNAAWVAIEAGTLRDEDVQLRSDATLTNFGAAGSPPFDAAPASPTTMPTIWRAGAGGEWYIQAANNYPMFDLGVAIPGYAGSRHPYNQDLGGGAWQLTEVASGNEYLIHVLAWNDIRHRLVGVLGQVEYSGTSDVRNGAVNELQNLSFEGMPFPEFKPLFSLLCETNTGYSNAPKSRYIETAGGEPSYVDWRGLVIPTVVSPIA